MKHANPRISARTKIIIGGILATTIALIVPPWNVVIITKQGYLAKAFYGIEWNFILTPPTVEFNAHRPPSISLSILAVELVFIGVVCAGVLLYFDKGKRNVQS